MSLGWSDIDKAAARKAATRAQASAENEALQLFQAYQVKSVESLWNLELKIRDWRRDRKDRFHLNYEIAEDQIADWLGRGWLAPEDIRSLSEARLERIKAKSGYRK